VPVETTWTVLVATDEALASPVSCPPILFTGAANEREAEREVDGETVVKEIFVDVLITVVTEGPGVVTVLTTVVLEGDNEAGPQ
jgi:hypothetical protein